MLPIQQVLLNINIRNAKKTNPNTNIYSPLEQSSNNNTSIIDGNEESSESTSFLNKLKAARIFNINRLMIVHININSIRNNLNCSQIALKATWIY